MKAFNTVFATFMHDTPPDTPAALEVGRRGREPFVYRFESRCRPRRRSRLGP